MSNLAGLHDIEATAIAAPDTWIVDTVAIGERPPSKHYPSGVRVIARLNYGYGSTGTLPLPEHYAAFAQHVAQYVNGCIGCTRWIIGNETNLPREWPDHEPIYPWDYVACYRLCRNAIHALPGHAQDEVLVAASGPWNNELKYEGNAEGDWITYFSDVVHLCDGQLDGFALHSYTHGYDPALVTSTTRMDRPFQNRYYNFRAYQDYMFAIPETMRYKSVYITEANGDGPWQSTGLMPAMLQEIDTWNRSGEQKISCVVFYRYPHYDQFYIEGRGDVIAEYKAAVARGYESPSTPILPIPPLPPIAPPIAPPEPEPARDIDPRLLARGVNFDFVQVPAGTGYWRIIKAQWLDRAAQQVGPDHHIVGRLLREDDEAAGVPLRVDWPSGHTTVISKHDDPNALFNYDYAMGPSLNEYSIGVDDGNASDKASGIGMGKDGNPREHTSTWLTFEWTIYEGITVPILPPNPAPGGELTHPLPGAVITQNFYEESDAYEQYGFRAHNGCDLGGLPLRTPIRSIAAGIVAMSDFDPGYGHYVRVDHRELDCYFMYCHLDEPGAAAGTRLGAGDTVGLLGTSGNSTGVHLHLEARLQNKDGTYREDTPMSKGRCDPRTFLIVHGLKL